MALSDTTPEGRALLNACARTARTEAASAATLYRELFSRTGDAEVGILLAASQREAADATGLESTLAALRTLPTPIQDPRLAVLDGDARFLRGDYVGARDIYAFAAASAREADLPMVRAAALAREGAVLRGLGAATASFARFQQARALYVAAGERGSVADAMARQAFVLYDQGEHRRAASLLEKAIELARQTGNLPLELRMLGDLAGFQLLLGDHGTARQNIDTMARRGRHITGMRARVDYLLGWERLHAGDARTSLVHTRRAIEALRGDRRGLVCHLWDLGEAALLAGDLREARQALEQAVDVGSGTNFRPAAECTRVLLAATAQAEGDLLEAEALVRRALGELDRMGVRDCRIRGRVVLYRILRTRDHLDDARAALAGAAAISPPTEDVWIRWELEGALADDLASRGDVRGARARLVAILDEADRLSMQDAVLAASIALGKLELSDPGSSDVGRARLARASHRARVLGQSPVALHARASRP